MTKVFEEAARFISALNGREISPTDIKRFHFCFEAEMKE